MDTDPIQSTNPTTPSQPQDQPAVDNKPMEQVAPASPPPIKDMPHVRTIGPKINIFSIMTILLLMGGLFAGLTLTQQNKEIRSLATNTGPKLSLIPATKSLNVGQTTSLSIMINTSDDTVSAVELHLTYDKTAIQITGFTAGSALPVVLKPAIFSNGTIDVTLGVQPATPFKGTGILGIITIKILSAKVSSIQITKDTVVAALGKTTNSLALKIGSTITGIALGTSTPTPTQIPNAIDTPTPTIQPAIPTQTPTPSGRFSSFQRFFPTPIPTPTVSPNKLIVGFGDIQITQTPDEVTQQTFNTNAEEIPATSFFQQMFTRFFQFFQQFFQK